MCFWNGIVKRNTQSASPDTNAGPRLWRRVSIRWQTGLVMKVWSLIFGLILCSCALAQQVSPVLLGSWTATAGPGQIFRGTSSAQTNPAVRAV